MKYIDAEEITPIMAEYVADVFSRREHLDNISYGYCMEIADVFRRYAERAEQEQPSEDLEKAAESWAGSSAVDAFKAGAQWQKERFEKNRLAACDNQTKEDYDRETAFVEQVIEKEHRQPTFSDAINYGMMLQREQMMKDAEPAEIGYFNQRGLSILTEKSIERMPVSEGDKVKIIIVKED